MILLDRYVKILRLSQVSANRTSFTTYTTTIDSTIQPLGDSKSGLAGGSFSKMYKIFMDVDMDVKEGDRVKDASGNIYQIEAGSLENRTDGFMADYLEFVAKKIN